MDWPNPRPEAVDRAVAWLRENDSRFTEEALVKALREQGYAEVEIASALERRRIELPALPSGPDLRGRAAAILVVSFLAVWGAISLALIGPGSSAIYGAGGIAALILGGLLLAVLLLGLLIVYGSKRLKRGVEGAMVAVLVLPFVLMFIIAGACLVTTRPFG